MEFLLRAILIDAEEFTKRFKKQFFPNRSIIKFNRPATGCFPRTPKQYDTIEIWYVDDKNEQLEIEDKLTKIIANEEVPSRLEVLFWEKEVWKISKGNDNSTTGLRGREKLLEEYKIGF